MDTIDVIQYNLEKCVQFANTLEHVSQEDLDEVEQKICRLIAIFQQKGMNITYVLPAEESVNG